jgi:hypothetical protein
MESMETLWTTFCRLLTSPHGIHETLFEDSMRTVRTPHGVHGNLWVSVKYSMVGWPAVYCSGHHRSISGQSVDWLVGWLVCQSLSVTSITGSK